MCIYIIWLHVKYNNNIDTVYIYIFEKYVYIYIHIHIHVYISCILSYYNFYVCNIMCRPPCVVQHPG